MDLASKKRKADENGAVLSAAVSSPRLTLEDALKILEPFTAEDLRSIVSSALVTDSPVLSSVRSIADHDSTKRKLFIRGLGWDTTTENLRSLFSTFGELEEAVVICDKQTGKSKGYGFITFKHVDGALLALKEPSKNIDGRVTVTQLAAAGNTGGGPTTGPVPDVALRKIYVGNVPPEMSSTRLLALFSSYGEIEEGPLGIDKLTGKFRGYAMFVYKSVEAAQAAIDEPTKLIDGHQLTCKLAIDGKKGKLGGPGIPVPGGFDAKPGDAPSMGSMPGQLQSSYLGYSGNMGIPGRQGLPHHNSSLQPSVGVGLSSMGSQVPASLGGSGVGGPGAGYAGGLGGPYGSSSQYAGQASAGGYGGLGMGIDSGFYNRMPPSSVGMGAGLGSGGFPESRRGYAEGGPYSMSSLGHSGHPKPGSPPGSMMPPGGGMYRGGMPPYY